MTPDLAQAISIISRLNVSMKIFHEVELGQAVMSMYWVHMGVVPILYVQGSSSFTLPFSFCS